MTTLYNDTVGKSLSVVPTDELTVVLNNYEKLCTVLGSLTTESFGKNDGTILPNIKLLHNFYGRNAVQSIKNTLDLTKDTSSNYNVSRLCAYSSENSVLSTIKIVNKNVVIMPVHILQILTNHDTTLSNKVTALINGVDYPLQKFTVMEHSPYFIHHSQHEGAGKGNTFYYVYTGHVDGTGKHVFYDLISETTVNICSLDLHELTEITVDRISNMLVLSNLVNYLINYYNTDPIAQVLLKACKYTLRSILIEKTIEQNKAFVSGRITPYCNDPIRKALYDTTEKEQSQYVANNFIVHKSVFTNLRVDPSLVPKTDKTTVEDMYIDTYLDTLCSPKYTS